MPIASSKKTAFAFLPVLTGLFTATLLISNVLNCKVIRVGRLPFTGGLIMFPLAAPFGDVLRRSTATRRAACRSSLGASGGLRCDSGDVPRIVAASVTAYHIGEFSNSYVLAKCKVRTHGSFMFWRFVLPTLVGQFIDSAMNSDLRY
jgi:queuosine precursor transporter